MSDEPRECRRMLDNVDVSHEVTQYLGDNGMWTVIEITKRQLLKAPSRNAAEALVVRLKQVPPA